MRIAITAPFYVPAVRAGGPVPGIEGVIRTLVDHDVWVFTGDRDLGDTSPYEPPYVGTTHLDGIMVSYLAPPGPGNIRSWIRALRSMRASDVIYANSCFSAPFTLLPLLTLKLLGYSGRVVISPRGELADAALKLGRTSLKWGWLWLIKRLGMDHSIGRANNVTWLASSAIEASFIEKRFRSPRVAISPERLRPWHGSLAEPVPPEARPLTVVSVGRVVPIKGTVELVRAALKARRPLRLKLIGLLEDRDYVDSVKSELARCPDHVQVELAGPLPPDKVRAALLDADLFVSLTHGENFGHAIGEALQLGVPVLISDQTPWSFVAETGAGTVLTREQCADPARVAAELDRFADADLAARSTMSAAAVVSARRFADSAGQTTLLESIALPRSEPAARRQDPSVDDAVPRVLVISHNPFSNTQNNGKTLSGFFAGWPTDRLAQLFVSLDVPHFDVCQRFYRVTDIDMVRRAVGLGTRYTGPLSGEPKLPERAGAPGRLRRRSLTQTPLALMVRSAFWRRRHWYTQELRRWLADVDPQVVFFQSSNSTFAFDIVETICRDLDIPLVMETTDDYVTSYPSLSPVTMTYQCSMENAYTKAVDRAHHVFAIGDQMAQEYQRRFGGSWSTATNSVELPSVAAPESSNEPLRLVFSGNIALNRWRVLVGLGEALDILVRDGRFNAKLFIYSLQRPSTAITEALTRSGRVEFMGARDPATLTELQNTADFLVHVESFDRVNKRRARLSVSSKIPEYMAAGRDILAIGPADVASISYLAEHEAALVVNSDDPKRIATALMQALAHPAELARQRANARAMVERNHLRSDVQKRIRAALTDAVAARSSR